MSNLNLGTASGFAKATLSSAQNGISGASSVLNQIAGLNNEKWDIEESAYGHDPKKLVVFHVFKSVLDYNGAVDQVEDTISRRVVPFKFPYKDGQTTEDLGREGETIDFNILIFGQNYYQAYTTLLKEFNNPAPATLLHPVRGPMTVKFHEARVVHKSSERQAVAIHAKFVEHTFDVSFKSSVPTTKSLLAKAVGFISSINGVLTAVQSNLAAFSVIQKSLSTSVSGYQSTYTQALVALNTTFNSGSSTDLPSLLPTNQGNSTSFPTAVAPNDPFAGTKSQDISALQSPVLSASQARDQVSSVRATLSQLISDMEAAANGQGALIFYDQILTLRESGIALQQALELGIQTSNASVKNFTTPSVMSVREVCFENGITPDRSQELITLNPSLLSANLIPVGTILLVPTS